MKLWIPKNRRELKHHLRDPLFKNAYFLMLSSVTTAGSGFFFWLIAARFYSTEDVGLASVIISAMGLVSMLSLLGFNISLIRFLPESENKADLIITCFTTSFTVSLILSLIFIAVVETFSQPLSIIMKNKFLLSLFLIYTPLSALTALQSQGVFIGFRKAEYTFYQTITSFSRLFIIPFLTVFGAIGIYFAQGLTSVLAFFLGLFLISKILNYKPFPKIRRGIVIDIFHFASGNYIASIFANLPSLILPILVVNFLGAEKNAYFFIAWSISGLLLVIPGATSTSLLTEGSYNKEELKGNVKKAAKFIFLLLATAVIGIFLFGRYVLWLFGEAYAQNSFEVLWILALASFPFAFNSLYIAIKEVQKEIKPVIYVYGAIALITIAGSYVLMPNMGIIGVGIAWVIGNGVVAGGIGFKRRRCRI
jgi:O-antigen/teichoic acid export membrane protein